MPAALPGTEKYDVRLYRDDVDFIRGSLNQRGGSVTFTEWLRELVRREANAARARAGLPPVV